jgi:flagellar basal-body rod protein FlgF
MIQGIYTASQGMTPLIDKQDIIAHNLANANTTGFKQSGLFVQAYQKYLSNDLRQPFASSEIKVDEVYIDYSQGNLIHTGSDFDCSIQGSGFFTVMTEDGIRYTRNGNFSLSPEQLLVTSDGARVMGKDGFIRLEDRHPVVILEDGTVVQENNVRGTLKIADFEKPYRIRREGNGHFIPLLPGNPVIDSPGFVIKQGYLEGSNTQVIKNMVQMIEAFRHYESSQKALQAQDETLDRAVNQVGRIG